MLDKILLVDLAQYRRSMNSEFRDRCRAAANVTMSDSKKKWANLGQIL